MRNPRNIAPITGQALIGIWRSRGGGWYGVGYLVVFIVLEIRLLAAEIAEANDLLTFFGEQLLESLFRMLTGSLENMILAFMWPFKLIESLGAMYGIALLVTIHLLFEHMLRPVVEQHLPELRADRIAREEKKASKKSKKSNKASGK